MITFSISEFCYIHLFDPLVGSGGSMPTPAPVGLPGLVPVP